MAGLEQFEKQRAKVCLKQPAAIQAKAHPTMAAT
jgi:hypothetical protein